MVSWSTVAWISVGTTILAVYLSLTAARVVATSHRRWVEKRDFEHQWFQRFLFEANLTVGGLFGRGCPPKERPNQYDGNFNCYPETHKAVIISGTFNSLCGLLLEGRDLRIEGSHGHFISDWLFVSQGSVRLLWTPDYCKALPRDEVRLECLAGDRAIKLYWPRGSEMPKVIRVSVSGWRDLRVYIPVEKALAERMPE